MVDIHSVEIYNLHTANRLSIQLNYFDENLDAFLDRKLRSDSRKIADSDQESVRKVKLVKKLFLGLKKNNLEWHKS